MLPKFSKKRGTTLPEAIVYIAVLALLSFTVIYALTLLARSHAAFSLESAVTFSTGTALSRIDREIANADSVDVAGSTFNTNGGVLVYSSSFGSETATVRKIKISSGELVLEEAGVEAPLMADGITITSLIFRRASSATSEIITIEMLGMHDDDPLDRIVPFRTSVVPRKAKY
ncbi:MAG: hypothetical protein AAB682_02780 [Patescibacteria group bacterium]